MSAADWMPVVDLTGYAASIERLRTRVSRTVVDDLPIELIELETCLEELEVGGEELRVQAEALAAEHGLRIDAQSRYRHLFDAAPVGLIETDANGLLLVVNRTAHRQLGLRPTSTARPLALYASASDRPLIRQMTGAALRSGTPLDAEVGFAAPGAPGRAFLVSVVAEHAEPPRHEGHEPAAPAPVTLLWTLHDLSRERRVEAVLYNLRHAAPEGDDDAHAVVVRGVVDSLAELDLEGDDPLPLLERIVRLVHSAIPEAAELAIVADLGRGEPVIAEHHYRSSDGAPLVSLLMADARQAVRSGHGLIGATLGSGSPQLVTDVRGDPRWAALAPVARAYGLAGLLTVPVAVRGEVTSVLVAASAKPGGFTAAHAARLAEVAPRVGTVVGNVASYLGGRELASQLETAIVSRGIIDQAKGILMSVLSIDADAAFAELRRRSAVQHAKLRDVAAALVADPGPAPSSSEPETT